MFDLRTICAYSVSSDPFTVEQTGDESLSGKEKRCLMQILITLNKETDGVKHE